MTHSKTETRTPQKKRGRKAQRALERPAAKPQHDTQARQSEGVQEPKSQNIAQKRCAQWRKITRPSNSFSNQRSVTPFLKEQRNTTKTPLKPIVNNRNTLSHSLKAQALLCKTVHFSQRRPTFQHHR